MRTLTTRAVGRITSLPQQATHTEVTAAVYVCNGERGSSLKSAGEAGKVGLIDSLLLLRGIGEEVEDSGKEIAPQTLSRPILLSNVDPEVGLGEGAILDATTTGAALLVEAKGVLAVGNIDKFTIAAEASGRREDLGVVGRQ